MKLRSIKIIIDYLRGFAELATALAKRKCFFGFYLYNKYEKDQVRSGALKLNNSDSFAIVIQGPLIVDYDFTVETVKTYRHNFKNALLIVSTWHIPEDVKNILNNYNVVIIENEKPENAGISNTNLQIVTTRAGILAAKDLGVEYVLKTRTDQRIYHPSLDAYLFNLLKSFPLMNDLFGQRERFVAISLNTHMYRMYGISDMFLFGHIVDMLQYWNIPLDKRCNPAEDEERVNVTWRDFALRRVCEVYFCTEYLKRIGRKVNYSLRDSFEVTRDHFVVIDHSAIKLYWHKYTRKEDRYSQFGFFDSQLTFNDWLILYQSLDQIKIEEEMLDQLFYRAS
jgi:hypothetical protein